MTNLRTKEQVAFDGIKVSWQKDPFTDILNHQARTKFSMDGVVPPSVSAGAVRLSKTTSSTVLIKRKYKDVLSGKINGISFPWGRRYAA